MIMPWALRRRPCGCAGSGRSAPSPRRPTTGHAPSWRRRTAPSAAWSEKCPLHDVCGAEATKKLPLVFREGRTVATVPYEVRLSHSHSMARLKSEIGCIAKSHEGTTSS